MVQDATAGIYVFVSQLEHPLPACGPGDVVELEGESGPGEFAPMIVARRITVVGHGPMPPARPTSLGRLLAGLDDSQLVQFDGVVRDITRDDQEHLIIWLSHDNQRFMAYVPSFGSTPLPPGLGVDAEIRVTAVVGARFNTRRESERSCSSRSAQIQSSSRARMTPAAPTATCRFAPAGDGHLMKIKGTVLVARRNEIFIRDEAGGLEVRPRELAEVTPGDAVEVVGFPQPGAYGPTLEDATVKRVGRAVLPEAHLLPGKDLLKNELDGELVRIRGVLRQHVVGEDEDVLMIEAGATALSALLEHRGSASLSLELGSVVEVSGVASVQASRAGNRLVPSGLRLFLAGPARSPVERRRGTGARVCGW